MGSSLKSDMWLPLTRPRGWSLCDTWHHSFHPGGCCTADGPPSPNIPYSTLATGWEKRTIQLLRSAHIRIRGRCYLEYIRGQRFSFPGQLDSEDTHDLPDPFMHAIKKVTPTILLTKSLELSLIFNTIYAWQDTPKPFQIAWRIPGTENHKLRWQLPFEYPSDSHHLAPEGSWLLRHPMSCNHDYWTR